MRPKVQVSDQRDGVTLILSGRWEALFWPDLEQIFAKVPLQANRYVFDCTHLKSLDTVGAWILGQLLQQIKSPYEFHNCRTYNADLIEQIRHFKTPPDPAPPKDHIVRQWITKIGQHVTLAAIKGQHFTEFLGHVLLSMSSLLWRPQRFRFKFFLKFVEEVGIAAMPIVGLISLLIGVVLVYQSVSQLEKFGASVFTVNLLAVSILRELGILLTAIVVAGRSGSAFTAQIGFMKLNQEIDAMQVLGLNPIHILVIPRIVALVIVLPLLTIFSNFMALLGGGFLTIKLIGLPWVQFIQQLQLAVSSWTLWTGLMKAPVFAFVIALIGCYEGLQVSGGAEDVGRQTTKSVVLSIFWVIVLDAIFSIIYSELEI